MEYKNNIIQFKTALDDGMFYGYASVFNVVDSYDDIIVNGAFKKAIDNKDNIKLCWQHNINDVIGKFVNIREDSVGLYVEGKINIEENKKIYSLVKGEFVNGLSIGYTVNDCYFDKKNRRILTNINLKEISIVAFPANKHSNILYCKSNDTELKKANDIIDKLINVFNV